MMVYLPKDRTITKLEKIHTNWIRHYILAVQNIRTECNHFFSTGSLWCCAGCKNHDAMNAQFVFYHYNQLRGQSHHLERRNERHVIGKLMSWGGVMPEHQRGQVIVNIDAAHRSLQRSTQKFGSGGILFRTRGGTFIVAFSIFYGPRGGDATEVEAETLYVALKIIEKKCSNDVSIRDILVQSDSKYAVEMYNRRRAVPENMKQIMEKCSQVSSNMYFCGQ